MKVYLIKQQDIDILLATIRGLEETNLKAIGDRRMPRYHRDKLKVIDLIVNYLKWYLGAIETRKEIE